MPRVAFLVALLLSCAPAVSAAVQSDTRFVFGIESEFPGYLVPIAGWSKGEFLADPGTPLDQRCKPFLQMMKPGKSFDVFIGGAPQGKATVKALQKGETPNSGPRAELSSDKPFKDNAVALNFVPTKRLPQRALTAAERAKVDTMARRRLLLKGLPPSELRNLAGKYQARDIDGDGKPEYLASYFFKARSESGKAYHLLLMAKAGAKPTDDYVQAFIQFTKVSKSKMMKGAELMAVRPGFLTYEFFDNVDIDGDGVDEIIIRQQTLEGTEYRIYARNSEGLWRREYEYYRYNGPF